MRRRNVTQIEVIEDFSSQARCDEGFLRLRRLWCRNARDDGSHSEQYRVDVIDRPKLDAVAVLVYRKTGDVTEFFTRQNLRPAAYFRKEKSPAVPDPRSHLYCDEIVAGLLEEHDLGFEGVKSRAAIEVKEESGFDITPSDVVMLGSPFFVAPGILSERIYVACVDVTGKIAAVPEGDGTPLEEHGELRWRTLESMRAAISSGEIQDAKTEIALNRFVAQNEQ